MTRRREPENAKIDSLTHDGRGIAAIAGKKIFVPGALPGEEVRILRRKIRRGHDEADLLEVLVPSPGRVKPRCEAFGICGGCALQHVAAVEQREVKQKSLKDSLERIGNVSPDRWLPPLFDVAEEGAWRYRRRARLAVRDVAAKGRVLVGFKERRAAIVTDMHRCEVLSPPLGELIDPLSDLIGQLSIRARLPQVEPHCRQRHGTSRRTLRLLSPPTADDRAKLLQFGKRHGLRVSLQPGGLESVVPLDPETRREALSYELPEFDVRVYFEATDFVQVNGEVNRRMVALAVDLERDRVGHVLRARLMGRAAEARPRVVHLLRASETIVLRLRVAAVLAQPLQAAFAVADADVLREVLVRTCFAQAIRYRTTAARPRPTGL